MSHFFMGIDPGQAGGIGLLCGRDFIRSFRFKDKTEAEIKDWLVIQKAEFGPDLLAAMERVSASPQMGVVSAFKFGMGYGILTGLLAGLEIPFRLVTPQTWQKKLGCLTKGDKNITKAMAHREWPQHKATHADADALLISLWLSRTYSAESAVA